MWSKNLNMAKLTLNFWSSKCAANIAVMIVVKDMIKQDARFIVKEIARSVGIASGSVLFSIQLYVKAETFF